MQAVLVMFRSDGDKRSFSITRDMTVIGRREDCDLRIPLNDISRKHCRLVRDGDMLRLEDLGSSNGTYLNGQRVQESLLAPGDSVQIGPVVFVLQVDGVPAEEELQPITADLSDQAAAPEDNNMGPLSPTAQSEVGEMPHDLEPLPMGEDEAGLEGLSDEPLDLSDEPVELTEEPVELSEEPAELTEEPAALAEAPLELSDEPLELSDEPLDLSDEPIDLADEPIELADEPLDLDLGNDGHDAHKKQPHA